MPPLVLFFSRGGDILLCNCHHFHRMLKFSAVALAALSISFSIKAADLRVGAGQEFVVGAAEQELRLDALVLEDGATIRFEAGVRRWLVEAERAEIGRDVTIDGRGMNGASGAAGASQQGQADDCADGRSGSDGKKGRRGQRGVSVYLRAGLTSLGNLKILTDGGAGGAGGAGGRGEKGGDINYCRGGAGGDGGNGGPGAPGGDAGDIELILFPKARGLDMLAIRRSIEYSAQGGRGGEAGPGGAPGGGVEGRYRRGAGPGGKKWLAGGESGAVGQDGAHGNDGKPGQVRLSEDLKRQIGAIDQRLNARQIPAAQATVVVDKNGSGQVSLEARLDALQRRVERLERELREIRGR